MSGLPTRDDEQENAHLHDWVRETMSVATPPFIDMPPVHGSLLAAAAAATATPLYHDESALATAAAPASVQSSEDAALPRTPLDSTTAMPTSAVNSPAAVTTPLASAAQTGLGLLPSVPSPDVLLRQHHTSLLPLDIEASTEKYASNGGSSLPLVDRSTILDAQSASTDNHVEDASSGQSAVGSLKARWPSTSSKFKPTSHAQARWSSDGRNRPSTVPSDALPTFTSTSPAAGKDSSSSPWDGLGAVTAASSVRSTPPPSISAGGSSSWSMEGHQNRMRFSATESSHARTPSLGDKAFLSPDSRIDFETHGIFPAAHVLPLSSTHDIRIGTDDWRTRSHGMARSGSGGAGSPLDGIGNGGGGRIGAPGTLGRASLERPSLHAGSPVAPQTPALLLGGVSQGALMGLGGGGHFGPGVRAKVAEVLENLIATIPLLPAATTYGNAFATIESEVDSTTVSIAEYGCLNSRSMQLMRSIIQRFAERANATLLRRASPAAAPSPFFNGLRNNGGGATHMLSEEAPSRVDFSVVHEDSPSADFRTLTQLLDTDPESYLAPHWQTSHSPSLQNHIFHSFVARPFASRVAPRNTLHLGFSLMDLHWSHTPRNSAISLSTAAAGELTAFLTARAHEFKKGGIFVMAYIARSETETRRPAFSSRSMSVAIPDAAAAVGHPVSTAPSSAPAGGHTHARCSSSPNARVPARGSLGGPPPVRRTDIWTTLTNTLAPCLQRLVSCGMLKSDIARLMLVLPMHPRTPRQTQAVLSGVRHLWKVEWSCGLEGAESEGVGEERVEQSNEEAATVAAESSDEGTPSANELDGLPPSEVMPLRLAHPAWTALEAGALSHVAFAEHMMQLFKNLYETHFRVVLRDRGKLSKGATEFVLDSLWDVLHSRIEDSAAIIKDVEVEVSICALRRI